MSKAVVTFGEIMGRLSTENFFTLRQSLPGPLTLCFAGAEANVAASIALLGGRSRFVTAMPDNDITQACLGNLRNLGVDTSCIRMRDVGRLGLYFVQEGANQRPGKVIYDRDGSTLSMTAGDEYDWDAIFKDACFLHVTGITPAVSRTAAEAQLQCMKEAKKHGLEISFDCNFRTKLWNWDPSKSKVELASEVLQEMMQYVDILFAGREDAEILLGIKAGCPENMSRIEAQPYIAEALASKYPGVKLLATTFRHSISATYNQWGAAIYDIADGQQFVSPCENGRYVPYDITAIVDRIGAGDSFAAAFIYAYLDEKLGKDRQMIVDFATAASCLCHSIQQDINFVSREDVLGLLQSGGTGRVSR